MQKNETTRQKSVHDYVVNTLNSSARVYEWTFLHDSDPWQEHMSVHARFCSTQTQDFSDEHTISRRYSADMFPSK